MPSVSINAPKTPVTEGSMGIAAATVPNVCKMPGPPAPFVPVPLPNIGKSGDSPQGYSTSVTIEGNKVAIRGATFKSMGDVASKGTGGGLVSMNTHGATSFVGPGSMNVKIEGKNVQLLGDPMLNNNGPSGNPPNSATMMGVIQLPGGVVTVLTGEEHCALCGKSHGERTKIAESDNTRPKCSALHGALNAMVPPVATATMLGVVECRCSKFYADNSGQSQAIIGETARGQGCKAPVGSSPVTSKAWVDSVQRKLTGEAKKRFVKQCKMASDSLAEGYRSPDYRTGFPPGKCAAQKAVVLAQDAGGLPNAITEQYYCPAGGTTANPITYLERKGPADPGVVVTRNFRSGEAVPPCSTCEIVLPMLLCPNDKPGKCR